MYRCNALRRSRNGQDSPMGSKGSPLMTTKLPFSKGSSSLSNQLDELVMLLANLGIDIRQVCRQGQLARQREEEVRDEHQQWLESLMNRAQSESKD